MANNIPTNSTTSRAESSKPKSPITPISTTKDASRRKILLLGSGKAGKSSCIKTVFQQVPVKDTSYFGVTQKIEKIDYDTIVPIQIWDTPPDFELESLGIPLNNFSTLVYVMDMQQDETYHQTIGNMVRTMLRAAILNPSLKFWVLIHKSELSSEDYRGENYAEIQRTFNDELSDFNYASLQPLSQTIDFSDSLMVQNIQNHILENTRLEVTSIHNVSLRDAWSKIIQSSMEMLPAVETLLLNFTETSGMDNSFLFDIKSGVVLATDNLNRNDATLELVTEYLSRFLQFRELYKELHHEELPSSGINGRAKTNGEDEDQDDEVDEEDGDDGEGDEEGDEDGGWWDREDPSAPWMFQATKLETHTTLAFWQFTPDIGLVVLLRTDTWQSRRGMIEYNLTFLRQGVRRILMEV